jgi:transcriptional regulator with XRE-family HTH domain
MMTIEDKRLEVFKKLIEGKRHKEFKEKLKISQGYLSQILTGRKPLSEKTAIKFESSLNLIPGTLVKPQDVGTIASIEGLYADAQSCSGLDQASSTPEAVIQVLEERRLAILLAIIGNQPLQTFCTNFHLNTSYISQLINGVKTIGERSAKNLEDKLCLTTGTLMYPQEIDASDEQAVISLFNPESQHLSANAQGLLRQLTLFLRASLLTDEHINILKLTAGQFAKAHPAFGETIEPEISQVGEVGGHPEDLHFRVTLFNEWNPNMTISVMAQDKESAKLWAAKEHPDWHVIMARQGKPLAFEE